MGLLQSIVRAQEALWLDNWRHISLGAVSILVLYLIINEIIRSKARIPNFGGPRRLPLIGNLHQIRRIAAEQYRQWSEDYGAVYQIQLGNIPILVVNTAAAAKVIFANLVTKPGRCQVKFVPRDKVCLRRAIADFIVQ